ncbi:putative endoglucanase [Aspergillus mulundensis]|uniref:xyloglucan-specific endo-beta-1,4-glucanase n=1 Tax=Aspergillus mulundensis TaxID=1810919 RepID=A0A3D8R969_9EURO|nr:Xyloglucan-specific endo-beta-1,4-glucanase A [Aspergillus mulundensis]RDW70603.1 Xyloglucan-specific endo-beta-1,4-glucanase A [Aspergillus mulundensis]
MKLLALSLASLASAASIPSSNMFTRRSDFCGQYDTATEGNFIVYNNLWGQDNADSGSQCTGVDSANGDSISWHTSWSWSGGSSSVKSFANVAYQFTSTQLSSLSSIPSTWEWSYSTTDIVADVAYDLFTSSSAGGDSENEIMIWLAALGGAGPISSTGSSIASVTLGGVTWDLYSGPNGSMQVYSFVASSTTESFSADLMDFINYLVENQGLSTSQYLTNVQAGTEPFTGSDATFTVSSYSVSIS